ncbi:MAG: SLC13 family permease [Vicinamibacterales bacterium]
MPGLHAVAVLLVTVAAFYLYTRAWVRIELVSLLLLLALLLIFYVFPYTGEGASLTDAEVLRAFGHPALVAICSLTVVGRGLTATAALEPVIRLLTRVWKLHHMLGLLVTLILATVASAFVNDTPVLVLMLPMLLSVADRTGHPASRSLMPVNFAILTGGMLTSIGTSTNLLVLGTATDLGMAPMGMFAFTPIVVTALAVTIPYLWLVAPRLLPGTSGGRAPARRLFEARMTVDAGNRRLVGLTAASLTRALGRPVPLVGVLRGGAAVDAGTAGPLIAADELVWCDTPAGLREVATVFRAHLFPPNRAAEALAEEGTESETTLAELVVGDRSPLVGQTLSSARFAEAHHTVVVGLHRPSNGSLLVDTPVEAVPLAAGDVLLVQGSDARIAALKHEPDLLLVATALPVPDARRAPWALGIMAAVIVAAATHLLPIHVAAFMGAVAMLAKRCVTFDGVGRSLSLQVILLVASSLALGQSLVNTGAAAWVASGVGVVVALVPAAAQLAIFMLFAAVLTNFVSNSAAAAVGTPIAVATARALGSPVEPFVLAILFGANLSFATPMAYQTNLMVMQAAGYRFGDFVRVGTPLVVLMLVTLSYLLAANYGL